MALGLRQRPGAESRQSCRPQSSQHPTMIMRAAPARQSRMPRRNALHAVNGSPRCGGKSLKLCCRVIGRSAPTKSSIGCNRKPGRRPSPSIALEFLRDNGLVHRIESRNAFVACVHNHESGDLVIFLICERCGAVGEAPGGAATEALKASSRAAGFSPKSPLIEVAGICAHCRDR